MIARVWRAVVAAPRTELALAHLRRTGIRACQTSVGNRGVLLLRRQRGDMTDVLFLSFWESMEAVRTFAGPDIDKAVSYAADADYLIEGDTMVAHYDVAVELARPWTGKSRAAPVARDTLHKRRRPPAP